ncbi:unnamed protein product [Symbiodinium sp. CCMP2592]|nr:unnamed protein product [Symbiodinium sp. CCMP2592]
MIMCLRPAMALPYSDQAIPDAKEARTHEVPAVLKADVSWLVEVLSDGLDLHELGRVGMTCRAMNRETQSPSFLGRLTQSWALKCTWVSFAVKFMAMPSNLRELNEWLVIQEQFAADDDGQEEENMEINDKETLHVKIESEPTPWTGAVTAIQSCISTVFRRRFQ